MTETSTHLFALFTWALMVGALIATVRVTISRTSVPWPSVALVLGSLTFLALSSALGATHLAMTGEVATDIVGVVILVLRAFATVMIVAFVLRWALPSRLIGRLENWVL